ncbi:cation transporter [Bifidobacterium psychraerophilum]|uniref:Cation efflux family protein n=1 Tax=Bifidobacterium psychraerophilum TaxID=218140 RepID=A0A087CHW2_9BIFI|nr:cation transporter [Bifidobacterium psychraerophilum]KFI82862.1 Cation efflux family protein [Bifidobacterium psychraerophilum]PKA94610.1 divalent metal cation (Fe/Co/Zn/Cd) transporter [Bifidobacterium psychraerophilum DSM 22366]
MIAGTRTRNPESNALLLGTFVNAGMGLAGLAVYLITDIQALLLDAAFTIISVVSGIVSILVSRTSSRRSARYPYGRFALESLYMLAKSALIIALMGLTLWKVSVKAYAYLRSGTGEAMNVGPVIIYEIVMVSCGFCLYAFFRFRNRQMNNTSSLLRVESTNARIDALMSGGIGVAAIVVSQIPHDSPFSFLLYTGDFFITAILTVFTIKDPVVMCVQAWSELSNGTLKSGNTSQRIREIVQKLSPEGAIGNECMVFRQGKGLRVAIPVEEHATVHAAHWAQAATSISKALNRRYGHAQVEYVIAGQAE